MKNLTLQFIILLLATIVLSSCKGKATKGCTDSTALNYDKTASIDDGSCTYTKRTVGENYGGGIIFYVDASGHHGLIAAPTDQSIGVRWNNVGYVIINSTSSAIGTGQANTTAIINKQGAGSYAAKLCDSVVIGGYSDWFLPSKDELKKMHSNLAYIGLGNFAKLQYWSSTQYADDLAYYIGFDSGWIGFDPSGYPYHVRAARAF